MIAKIVGIKIIIQIQLNAAPLPAPSEKTPVVPVTQGGKTAEAQITGKNIVAGRGAYLPRAVEVAS